MNAPRPPEPSPQVDERAVERFLIHEARLLDERRFEEWMGLFTDDGHYWAPARPDQPDPWSEVSLMFDDREIMRNRIQRLRHPKVYAQLPHSRAVRQVSNVSVESVEPDGDLTTRAVFFMFEHRPTLPEHLQRIFAGHCFHRLRRTEEGFRIVTKKAVIANCDEAFDPLFLYF